MHLITNNRPRLHAIGLKDGSSINLSPGVNQVESDRWLAASTNPMVRRYLERRDLEVRLEGAPDGYPLKELPAAEAADLVAETFHPPLLELWAKQESRRTVIGAIDRQLRRIETLRKKKAETDEGPAEE